MKTLSPHDWREKHPRCSFCQWLKFETVKVDLEDQDGYDDYTEEYYWDDLAEYMEANGISN